MWSSPARGYKFGCVCSYMAGHYPGILMTGHAGTNPPKCVPPRWGRPRFDPTQTGLCKFGRGVWSSLMFVPLSLGCPCTLSHTGLSPALYVYSSNFRERELQSTKHSVPPSPHKPALPNISTSFPPQSADDGNYVLKSGWAGKFQEIQVSVELGQTNPVRGIPGYSFWGTPFS